MPAKFLVILNNDEKKRLLSNFLYLSLLQAANYALPLLTFPYLVRVLGMEYFGLLAFASATVAYFNIITDYGFNITATREISLHTDNPIKISEIFNSVMIIKIGLIISSTFLLIILIVSFEKFSQDWLIYLLAFGVVIGQTIFPTWFFQGMEQMKYITYINVLSKVIFTVPIFIFVQKKEDFYLVPLLGSLGAIIGGVWSIYLVKRNFKITFQWQNTKTLLFYLREASHIFASNVAISLYTVSTIFFLGIFTNNTTTGYYAAADRIIQAVKMLNGPIIQSIYPYMAKKFSESTINSIAILKKISIYFGSINLLICLLVFNLANEIVTILLGEKYVDSVLILKLLAFTPFFIFLSNIFAVQGLYAMGLKKIVMKFVISISLFHIFLILITVPTYNELGAASVTLFTEALIMLASILFFHAESKKVKKC